ncbi:MAG: tRNA1(Val) (adenine(37)-N6)-methyltransferase [Chitinophagales bacterium]
MSNSYFRFKQFTIHQDRCAMKVTTDACLFGAWVAGEDKSEKLNTKNILDIGTGTGLLSLMYVQKKSFALIDAIEIDEGAYEQAKENIAASPFAERIRVINDDVKTCSFTKKYDEIISNPPFYEKEIRSANEKKNMAHHQEGLLLEDLLDVIKQNLSQAGVFYLLLPFKRNEEIRKILLKQTNFVSKIVFVRQSIKHNYFRLMIKGKLKQETDTETMIEEISIRNDSQQYTDEFKELLKDYYLNF